MVETFSTLRNYDPWVYVWTPIRASLHELNTKPTKHEKLMMARKGWRR